MIISDKTIESLNLCGKLIEQPITNIQLQPNSVDLTLSNMAKIVLPNSDITEMDYIDSKKEMKSETIHISDKGIKIKPGDFYLMSTNEIINIPNGIVGLVIGRSSIARMGIQIETAGFVDAGFRGTITLEVANNNNVPIILYPNMRICQIYFIRSEYSTKLYGNDKGSKYHGQIEPTVSKICMDIN